MKSYKDIRSKIDEEYYTGPTGYVGGDKTNVGNIGGADLGGLANGSRHKPYVTQDNMKVMGRALQGELQGVHSDPVGAITKARTKLTSTGLSFHIDPAAIRMSAQNGDSYTTALNFGGQPLGDAPDRDPSDDFAARELGIVDSVPYEKTLPASEVQFTFTPEGLGVRISVDIM
jgi:hypothetical protein